jgi:hypothetical protein
MNMRVGVRTGDDTPVQRPYKAELLMLRERVERAEFLTYIALAMAGGLLLGLLASIVMAFMGH